MNRVKIIVAVDLNGGFSYEDKIPWNIKAELEYFKSQTKGHVIAMGHNTGQSIGRDLPDRVNYVFDRETDVERQIETLLAKYPDKIIWIIGGVKTIYKTYKFASEIYLTVVNGSEHKYDLVCEPLMNLLKYIKYHYYNESKYDGCIDMYAVPFLKHELFTVYKCGEVNVEERQINHLVKLISASDVIIDRTKIGTKSIIGHHMKFSMADHFPLTTTKPGFLRGIFEELMWFLRGQTDSKILEAKGVNIWVGNSKDTGGDCGPIYGFQWRHFGAKYVDCKTDYTGQGCDQIALLLNTIKTNPTSRRMFISGWNVSDLSRMVLPPCHVSYQFFVRDNTLSCVFYQRSSDVLVACHWNISSAALLCYLIADMCDLKLGDLYVSYGDTHIYGNHFHAIETAINRNPAPYPKLKITAKHSDITKYEFSDLKLEGYHHYNHIPLVMNV